MTDSKRNVKVGDFVVWNGPKSLQDPRDIYIVTKLHGHAVSTINLYHNSRHAGLCYRLAHPLDWHKFWHVPVSTDTRLQACRSILGAYREGKASRQKLETASNELGNWLVWARKSEHPEILGYSRLRVAWLEMRDEVETPFDNDTEND